MGIPPFIRSIIPFNVRDILSPTPPVPQPKPWPEAFGRHHHPLAVAHAPHYWQELAFTDFACPDVTWAISKALKLES